MSLKTELIGKRFGKLVVLEYIGSDKQGHCKFRCKCDCGGESVTFGTALLTGRAKTCGSCEKRELNGKKFGHLTILNFDHYDKYGRAYYKVKCDCGNEKIVSKSTIFDNQISVTCGLCYDALSDSYIQYHHDRCVRLSKIYDKILSRTQNAHAPNFYQYGGRGILLQFSRLEFVSRFYKDDNFVIGLQVDRIDNDGNYTFENIRWVTPKDNSGNKSTSKGVEVTYDQISKRLISINTLNIYLNKMNVKRPQKFTVIDFPLTTNSGVGIKLFLHETVDSGLVSKTIRIVNFYKEFGYNLDLNKLTVRDIMI